MARLFGTDGVRGLAFGDVLTVDLARDLAAAAARELLGDALDHDTHPLVVIGRDTRPSGPELEAAAVEGFTSVGCNVVLLGVVPTPAVAHEVQNRAALGLMISASHNPVQDNGLKFFGTGGSKLSDAQEDAIEARLGAHNPVVDAGRDLTEAYRATSGHRDYAPPVATYVDHLVATVGDLSGLHVVVDGAQGSASLIAPAVYRLAGARVTAIHCAADGERINAGCGATHPESLAAAVLEHGADLGLAHDGDADRCIVVDGAGQVLNGDQVLGLLALARRDAGAPASEAIVVTVMSNLGLEQAMRVAGIEVVRTAVGDRYVLEALVERGLRFGGEQSGHVVMLDHATTGDGLLTGLQVMDRVVRTGRPVADLAAAVQVLPQVLVNVRCERSRATAPEVLAAVTAAEAELAGEGRVLLRPSGTEPLVRVMVEAPTQDRAEQVARDLAALVGAHA